MFGIIGAQIVLLAWIPVVLVVFMAPAGAAHYGGRLSRRVAAPAAHRESALPGLPDYTKTGAAVLSILLATIIFEPTRLFTFRPRWFDLPMLVFCVCPFFSSISNDLGAYDGIVRRVRARA